MKGKTMRTLVAGGTGVLGRRTLPKLIAAGHEVVAVSRRPESDDALRAAGAAPIRFDVFDRGAVTAAASRMDAVVNLATSIPSAPRALRMKAWEGNDRLRRDASRVLAEAAIHAGARFVQESFAPTYADHGSAWITENQQLDPVAQTRSVPEAEASAELVTSKGGAGVVLRFGMFYGAGSPDTRSWLESAARGRLMLPGPGHRYTTMVYVDDAAAAVVAALEVPAGCYNVVEDQPMTRDEHAAVLADLLGRRRVKLLPALLGRLPVLSVVARSHRISNKRLREVSDWRPTAPSVRQGWRMVMDEIAHAQ